MIAFARKQTISWLAATTAVAAWSVLAPASAGAASGTQDTVTTTTSGSYSFNIGSTGSAGSHLELEKRCDDADDFPGQPCYDFYDLTNSLLGAVPSGCVGGNNDGGGFDVKCDNHPQATLYIDPPAGHTNTNVYVNDVPTDGAFGLTACPKGLQIQEKNGGAELTMWDKCVETVVCGPSFHGTLSIDHNDASGHCPVDFIDGKNVHGAGSHGGTIRSVSAAASGPTINLTVTISGGQPVRLGLRVDRLGAGTSTQVAQGRLKFPAGTSTKSLSAITGHLKPGRYTVSAKAPHGAALVSNTVTIS